MGFPAHPLQPLLQPAAFAKIAFVSESIYPVSSEPAIEVRGLHKSYGSVEAVRGIDLRVAKGEVFALLGPNGAGKTTTIEILEGYLQRTSGDVTVLGRDPGRNDRSLKERIGIVLQTTGVEPYLGVEETINLFRGYYPHPMPLEEILRATGLTEQRKVRVRRLSGGQQRRLDVAIGLSGDPELLFLGRTHHRIRSLGAP